MAERGPWEDEGVCLGRKQSEGSQSEGSKPNWEKSGEAGVVVGSVCRGSKCVWSWNTVSFLSQLPK